MKGSGAFVGLMLSVRYAPDVPPALAEMAEHHARAAGLSLGALEVIGASLDFVEAFIVASEDGHGLDWARDLDLAPPAERVANAQWVAARLFGS
ncbi:MAG: hypothetical protein QOE90_2254 [Thermoplasmata archaeon]|jgi:hypothetical protein|nr:hypothetical protein [Thermoplasmata archaeon]